MSAVVPEAELCGECPLLGHRTPAAAVAPDGYGWLSEAELGVVVRWDGGDELHLTRVQVVELHELLGEYAGRWR